MVKHKRGNEVLARHELAAASVAREFLARSLPKKEFTGLFFAARPFAPAQRSCEARTEFTAGNLCAQRDENCKKAFERKRSSITLMLQSVAAIKIC